MTRTVLTLIAVATLAGCSAKNVKVLSPDFKKQPTPHVELMAEGFDLSKFQLNLTPLGAAPGVVAFPPAVVATVQVEKPKYEEIVPPTVAPVEPSRAKIDYLEPAPVVESRSRSVEPTCWLNPGGDAFHRKASCRYVKTEATGVPCSLAEKTRRPCRTCGGQR